VSRSNRVARRDGLVWHSDAGSLSTSIRYGVRIAEFCAKQSIGLIDDSYDYALAEAVNNLSTRELMTKPRGSMKTTDDLATPGWVACCNQARLHSALDGIAPVAHEAAFYAAINGPRQQAGIQ
jgi:putative transposase